MGGEEFLLILHNTSELDAIEFAQRIRKEIEQLKIKEIQYQKITASFGVSTLDSMNPYKDIIKEADIALYTAKKDGRNRVVNFTN